MEAHPPSGDASLDQQLQRYLRGAGAHGRDVERIGPFLATFSPASTNTYANYAIPDDGAEPSPADVAALVDAYRRRRRTPRLEYLPGAAPAVQAALLDGGFQIQAELPLMTCTAEAASAADLAPAPGVRIEAPAGDEDLRRMRLAQQAAFGMPLEEVDDDLSRQRADLAAGALALLARDEATGEVVGGGVTTVPGDGVTEIAGIGVLESHRRRGIAGALTAGLARAAFAAGLTTVWLTPGGGGAHRVYARAGFVDTTEMLHLWMPE